MLEDDFGFCPLQPIVTVRKAPGGFGFRPKPKPKPKKKSKPKVKKMNKHEQYRQLQDLKSYEIKARSELDQMWRNAEEHIDSINMLLESLPETQLKAVLTLVILQLRLNRLARQLDEM